MRSTGFAGGAAGSFNIGDETRHRSSGSRAGSMDASVPKLPVETRHHRPPGRCGQSTHGIRNVMTAAAFVRAAGRRQSRPTVGASCARRLAIPTSALPGGQGEQGRRTHDGANRIRVTWCSLLSGAQRREPGDEESRLSPPACTRDPARRGSCGRNHFSTLAGSIEAIGIRHLPAPAVRVALPVTALTGPPGSSVWQLPQLQSLPPRIERAARRLEIPGTPGSPWLQRHGRTTANPRIRRRRRPAAAPNTIDTGMMNPLIARVLLDSGADAALIEVL